MQAEDGGGEQRAGDPQIGEQPEDQQTVEGMQQDVGQVKAEGVQAPQVIFNPERRMHQRVVWRQRRKRIPDLPKPFEAEQCFVSGDVEIVVPNKSAPQRREVCQQRQQHQ